jgi:hypothetical protein
MGDDETIRGNKTRFKAVAAQPPKVMAQKKIRKYSRKRT